MEASTAGVRHLPNLDARIDELMDGLVIMATRRLGNRDDAFDAAQETIARLLERVQVGAIATEAELVPVAWGIARHVIVDMLRERARPNGDVTDVVCSKPGPLEQIVTRDQRKRVREALDQLSDDDRALLRRCFVEGERIGRIAEELGEPPERLRKRKSRALARLAKVLGSESGPARHNPDAPPMEKT
jgi:RNA polymerase sigma-70 factor (ECF subfamily)